MTEDSVDTDIQELILELFGDRLETVTVGEVAGELRRRRNDFSPSAVEAALAAARGEDVEISTDASDDSSTPSTRRCSLSTSTRWTSSTAPSWSRPLLAWPRASTRG